MFSHTKLTTRSCKEINWQLEEMVNVQINHVEIKVITSNSHSVLHKIHIFVLETFSRDLSIFCLTHLSHLQWAYEIWAEKFLKRMQAYVDQLSLSDWLRSSSN